MNRMADVTKCKALLPKELKYPLPDEVLDNLLDKKALFVDGWGTDLCNAVDVCTLAALIELKERRMQDESHG